MLTVTKLTRLLWTCAWTIIVLPAILVAQDETSIQFRDAATTSSPTNVTGTETAEGYRIFNCQVDFISEPELAFEEPGVVVVIPKEGERVEMNDVVAALNDEEVLLRIDIAQAAYDAAKLEASNDIRIRYSEMQSEVALADLKSGEEANLKQRNVVPEMEMRRRDAAYKERVLGVENAQHEQAIALATARVKEAELKSAQVMLKRLQLRSPITGIVTEKMRDEGEYVRAGDPVVRVGQLDRLRVDGRVPYQKFAPGEAYGKKVRIDIPVAFDSATGKPIVETFESQIQQVAAEVDDDSMYRVWAEIDNRNDFVVRPGMMAEMTILNE